VFDRSATVVRAALAVTLLVAGTGCLGTSPRASVTATPTSNTDCPPALTVYEIESEPADTGSAIAYGTLTVEQRETFHRARNGSVEDFDYAWHDIDIVAYEGRYYRAGIVVC
jgi:hypothetical protein